jgi:glucose-1-phosphate thymidylyltransferase
MKGIVLAGGTGSRLWPITKVTSKQLLPVYDKPMIYYPLSTLMLAGVREVLIITTPHDQSAFKTLLGDGSQFGIQIKYAIQPKPEGLAQAFIIGEEFLDGDSCLMILGDNIFHGSGLGHELQNVLPDSGAHIFTYEVADCTQYGILTVDRSGLPIGIIEKPKISDSRLAVTGLYYFDKEVSQLAHKVTPSPRGELEITSLIEFYLNDGKLTYTSLSRGTAWLDTGNPNAMYDAATYIRVIEERTGLKIACLEEIAWRNGWLTKDHLQKSVSALGSSSYGQYLSNLASK